MQGRIPNKLPTRRAALSFPVAIIATMLAVAAAVLFLILISVPVPSPWDKAVPFAIALAILGVPIVVQYQTRPSRSQSLQLQGSLLILTDGNDRQLARVDFSRDFEHQVDEEADGLAWYRIYQDDGVLEFHSSDPLAQRVAEDFLRVRWPPVDPFRSAGPIRGKPAA